MTPTRPALTEADTAQMHELYRTLHAAPELSMQEHGTAALIEEHLEALGISSFRCGGTGVVGVLANGEGPVAAFRADTDGLPIPEHTGLPYASTARGRLADGTEVPVMHGCGHDTHVTALLTTAKLLSRSRDSWAGTVVFLFQPGEETAAGAAAMVQDGLWEKAPKPDVVLGQHVMPGLAGTIQYASGNAMTQADSWKVTLHGRQSHGSQPQDSVDPIVLGAHIITRIQTIVSRELDPRRAAVVTVGTFHAGLKENIIPDRAEFTLNIRTFDDGVRAHVLDALRRIIAAEAAASAAPDPEIEELYTCPLNYNDPDQTTEVMAAMRVALGEDQVSEVAPLMGSEDFGHLAQSIGVPSVYWFFGGHSAETLEADRVPMNHSPYFAPVLEPTLSTAVEAALVSLLSRLERP
ncbi:MAG: amidohydrolase [Arthrobacter sp.]